MTWEEKLAALRALCDTTVRMRHPGNWYVCAIGRELQKPGSGVCHGRYGNGSTPQQAVEDDWEKVTNSPENEYVIIDVHGRDRRAVRWNGYMWADVEER